MQTDLFEEPTRRLVIGFAGVAGSGKDTAAGMLARMTGAQTYAFAGPLKKALEVLGISEPASRAAKELPMPGRSYSFRTAAQTLGTEWARNLDPDFWMTLASQKTANIKALVLTDVRFENEAAWVRNQGGEIWHMVGRDTTVSAENAKHASEVGLQVQPDDRLLLNAGTLADLEANVAKLVREWQNG